MINFYNDHLAPPELCRMLHEVVPSRYHVPLRFHNRRQNHIYGERGRVPCGSLFPKGNGRDPSHIVINLNPIYRMSGQLPVWRCAPSTALWYGLLEVCLHEFGHVATRKQALGMNRHEYNAEYGGGRVYQATEHLAREWQERSFERILRDDPRLGQPAYIRGYFGARLAKWSASARWSTEGCGCSEYIKEVRCRRSGAQLTAGDVLRWLEVDPECYTNAYKELLHASTGIGVEYTDGAGRRHRLYTWGDTHLVAPRFRHSELRERPDPWVKQEFSGAEDLPEGFEWYFDW